MWDLIVSVPDHCLSFYFGNLNLGYANLDIIIFDELVGSVQYIWRICRDL